MALSPVVRLVSSHISTIALVRRALAGSGYTIDVRPDQGTVEPGGHDVAIADARDWSESRIAGWLAVMSGARLIIADDLGSATRLMLKGLARTDLVFADIGPDDLRTRIDALLQRDRSLRVLLIEDEPRLAQQIAALIRSAGFGVVIADTQATASQAVATQAFDIMVLDRGLPDGDGLDVLKRLRARGVSTPALVLSALGEPIQRVAGLRGGADDYMAKPFDPDELLARIEVLLRPAVEGDLQRIGALEIYRGDQLVRWRGDRIDLTGTEFRLLSYLAERSGFILPVSMLRADVWDIHRQHTETNIVAAGIRRLRRKFADAGVPDVISTHAQGYRFDLLPLLAATDE